MINHAEFEFYGYFTLDGDAFTLEGLTSDDCLYVSRLISPDDAELLCVITGKNRNHSHEVIARRGSPIGTDDYRKRLIFEAVNRYRLWLADGRNSLKPLTPRQSPATSRISSRCSTIEALRSSSSSSM